ncbi:hypothetical protein SmJEL517_g01403 [Synchytrium microbalum]|uniref:Uncharacterized protein n=1 Tax=Synchytrium microbalum TaxID=1806994 RepID=A0A507C9J0_9FUNG|nr:uncharacterized protein SmJEL517_g01403 [Synchytrium microbalum]TPX36272.1 hypothetical protein SmJEL517_g01403 [Synchytrium microbalum]
MSVISASPPKSKLLISRGQGPFKPDNKGIRTHYFNRTVEMLIPIPRDLSPESITEISAHLRRHSFQYQQIVIAPTQLIAPAFLDKYIRKCWTTALTCDAQIDAGDVIAITPDGKKTRMTILWLDASSYLRPSASSFFSKGRMILNLTKDTYERAGLVGKKCKFNESAERFNVTIDIANTSFSPKSKLYDRVLWCLTHTMTTSRTFFVSCHDRETGEPVKVTFEQQHASTKEYTTPAQIRQMEGIMIPDIGTSLKTQTEVKYAGMSKDEKEEENSRLEELFEWLGMVELGSPRVSFMSQTNPFICVYEPPPTSASGTLLACRWQSSFISCLSIQRVVDDLQKTITVHSIPWASVMVWGFADAPVSWDTYEHGYFANGENDYACVFGKDSGWLLYQAVGSFDSAA